MLTALLLLASPVIAQHTETSLDVGAVALRYADTLNAGAATIYTSSFRRLGTRRRGGDRYVSLNSFQAAGAPRALSRDRCSHRQRLASFRKLLVSPAEARTMTERERVRCSRTADSISCGREASCSLVPVAVERGWAAAREACFSARQEHRQRFARLGQRSPRARRWSRTPSSIWMGNCRFPCRATGSISAR